MNEIKWIKSENPLHIFEESFVAQSGIWELRVSKLRRFNISKLINLNDREREVLKIRLGMDANSDKDKKEIQKYEYAWTILLKDKPNQSFHSMSGSAKTESLAMSLACQAIEFADRINESLNNHE